MADKVQQPQVDFAENRPYYGARSSDKRIGFTIQLALCVLHKAHNPAGKQNNSKFIGSECYSI